MWLMCCTEINHILFSTYHRAFLVHMGLCSDSLQLTTYINTPAAPSWEPQKYNNCFILRRYLVWTQEYKYQACHQWLAVSTNWWPCTQEDEWGNNTLLVQRPKKCMTPGRWEHNVNQQYHKIKVSFVHNFKWHYLHVLTRKGQPLCYVVPVIHWQ